MSEYAANAQLTFEQCSVGLSCKRNLVREADLSAEHSPHFGSSGTDATMIVGRRL
jgi:hypothetical protein